MASELYVETLKGLTSGANANKVIIPSGQTLDASAGGLTLPAGVGGKVLQVVQNSTSGATYTTSTSFVNTNLSASITPSSTSSKVLISFNMQVIAPVNTRAIVTVMRGNVSFGVDLGTSNGAGVGNTFTSSGENAGTIAATILDTPSTTGSQTYTVAVRNDAGGYIYAPDFGSLARIVLQEIAG